MRWGLVAGGLGVLAVAAIVSIFIAAYSPTSGVWLVAVFPFIAIAGGAILLAGREGA